MSRFDDSELLERMWVSMRTAFAFMPPISGGRVERFDGVEAGIVPAVPERSVFNSVFYDGPEGLERSYDELAQVYDDEGIQAWTVWVRPGDSRAAELLESRGHVLDAAPQAMGLAFDGWDPSAAGEVEWRPARDAAELADLNNRAYNYTDAPFTRAFGGRLPSEHTYVADVDGEAAACVGAIDAGGDCSIVWVATLPEARGRGLAGGLMRRAMEEARERGCETTSLQATSMGEPVYARLGYRPLGRLEMWELRKG